MENQEQCIEVGGQRFIRERVVARMKLVDEQALPANVAHASQATEGQLCWDDGKNLDLVRVQFVLDTEGGNANWDYMPREQLVASHSTAVFKPIDMEHVIKEKSSMTLMSKDNPPVINTICGVMTATATAWAKTGELLTEDELKDLDMTDLWDRPDDEKVAVVAWGALYNFLFPKTVQDLCTAIEDGQMFVSMERWIASYDFMVWDGKQFNSVSRADGEDNGIANRWKTHQMVEGKPVYRRSLSYIYGGVANTTNPANKMARFVEQAAMLKAAASTESGRFLRGLIKWHDNIHEHFLVAAASDKPELIRAHETVTRMIAAMVRT